MKNPKLEQFFDYELIEELRKRNKAVAVWGVDDVLNRAKDLKDDGIIDRELTTEEAEDIIEIIDSKQDCNIGINWDVISTMIFDHL